MLSKENVDGSLKRRTCEMTTDLKRIIYSMIFTSRQGQTKGLLLELKKNIQTIKAKMSVDIAKNACRHGKRNELRDITI